MIDSERSRYPERYSLESPAHGGQLVGSGRQSGPWLRARSLVMCAMAMPQPHNHTSTTQAHIVFTIQAPSNLVFDGVVRRRTRGHAGRVDVTFWVDGKTESFDAMQAREQRSQLVA